MKLNKKLLSIQIRDIALKSDLYQLKIQPQNMPLIEIQQTKSTIVIYTFITSSSYQYFLLPNQ